MNHRRGSFEVAGHSSRSRQSKPAANAETPRREDTPWLALALTIVYAAIVSYVASHHELWRDEVRAMNIAAGAQSIGGLFSLLRNEGHPPLWYLLLWAGFKLTHTMVVLKVASILCATGAVYLFLRYSPFPLWIRLAFLAGAFPMYEYSVICRNYGISMLLLFVVAALFEQRFSRRVPVAAALIFLANTNAYSLVIAAAFLFALILEAVLAKPRHDRRDLVRDGVAALTVFVGFGIAFAVMLPDETSVVSNVRSVGVGGVLSAAAQSIGTMGSNLDILTAGNKALGQLLFWGIAIYFSTRPLLLFVWGASAFGFAMLSALVYPADPFQRGLLFMLLLVLLWIDRGPNAPAGLFLHIASLDFVHLARDGMLAAVLTAQVYFAYGVVTKDVKLEVSSSERLGRFLIDTPELHDAIVIPEPDVMAEPLPYYAPNRIYLPREGKDLVKVNFTTASRSILSLDELLTAADELRDRSGKPILILIAHPLNPGGPFEYHYPFGREFSFTSQSLDRFRSHTHLLTVFDKAVSDENYALFRLN